MILLIAVIATVNCIPTSILADEKESNDGEFVTFILKFLFK